MKSKEQGNKKICFFAVAVLIILVLVGGFILYNNNKKDNNISSGNNPFLERKVEEVSKSNFGADMPRLGFANEKMVIIYDDNGIYIFNLVSGKLEGYFDFAQNGLGGLQGDNATFVNVSADGNSIYIDSAVKRQFIYNVKENSYKKSTFVPAKLDFWEEEKGSQKQVKTKKYYSISNIYNNNNTHKMFLALIRNDNLDYSSLAYVNSQSGKEDIYLLFQTGS